MKTDEALRAAYEGCDTTLAEARRSDLYAEALTANDGDHDAAILDHLGVTLMDASVKCLPPGAVEWADKWLLITADDQLTVLRWFFDQLTPPKRRHSAENPLDAPTLPGQMGEWSDPGLLPSCYLMAAIMAAFAKRAGMEFYVASVQRTAGELVAPGMKQLFDNARRLIETALPIAFATDPLPLVHDSMVSEATAISQTMVDRQQFHAAILIRLKDGRWACMDRYMSNFSVLDPATRPIDHLARAIRPDAKLVAAMRGKAQWEALTKLEQELARITELLQLIQTGEALDTDIPLIELPAALRQLTAERGLELWLSESDILRRAATSQDKEDIVSEAEARATIDAAEHGPDRAQRRERIIIEIIRAWSNRVWTAAKRAYQSDPHYAMAVSHPARSLAIWAIINLRHYLGKPWASDLMPYSDGDVVTYGCMKDSPRHLDPEQRRILKKRVAILKQAPPEFVHPLIERQLVT